MRRPLYVLAVGNPFDGIKLSGPYSDAGELDELVGSSPEETSKIVQVEPPSDGLGLALVNDEVDFLADLLTKALKSRNRETAQQASNLLRALGK